MKFYISGPMTGLPDFNYPAFFAAEDQLRSLGYLGVNPAHNDGLTLTEAISRAHELASEEKAWEWYLRRDIPRLIDSDAVLLLPGWQKSRGANLQVIIATSIGIPLYVFKDGNIVPRLEVIGLSGYARSGKDTVGGFLLEKGFMRASFADYIRKALYTLNPYGADNNSVKEIIDKYGWEESKNHHPEIREQLQRLGSEVGREILGENIWVDLTFRNMPDGSKIVVTDCRFPNEAESVKKLGGQVWRVERPGLGAANAHQSEVALDGWNFDATIINDGVIEDLSDKVEALLSRPQTNFN